MRIASLLPSATELICALDGIESLVGISHECDFPATLPDCQVLTRPRREFPKGSLAIDLEIRELVAQSLSVYEIDVEALRKCQPDLIVTQNLCEVCAVAEGDVYRAVEEVLDKPVKILSFSPNRLDHVWQNLEELSRAMACEELGIRQSHHYRAALAEISTRTKSEDSTRDEVAPHNPRVLSIEWLDPLMIGGTWMPEIIELAGGVPLVAQAGEHAPTLSFAELAALDPDVVLIKPCGYTIEATMREEATIRKQLLSQDWKANQTQRVFVCDGSAYFNRPGPRLLESAEIMAACLQPELFADFSPKHHQEIFNVWRGEWGSGLK